MKPAKLIVVAALLISAFAASLQLYRTLSPEPLLRGADAYYYALQANYFAKTGEVKIPDSSLIHRATGALQKSGWSSENALRLWECAALFLFFLTMLALLLGSNPAPSFSAALTLLYVGISPTLLFVAIEFPKFFLMLLCLPFWFWTLTPRRSGAWPAWSLIPLTCLFHRAALPLAAGFGLASLGVYLQKKVRIRKGIWIGAAATALLIGGVFFLTRDHFRFADLQRLTWSEPKIGFFSLLSRRQLPLALKIELVALPILAIALACRLWKNSPSRRSDLLPVFSLWLPAFSPFGGSEVFGVGERYAILLPAFSLMACLYFLSLEPMKPWRAWQVPALVILTLIPPLAAPWRLEAAHPRRIDPDFATYRQVSEALSREQIPMLIANKGLVFYYKFQWMREAFPYEPERHWDKTKIWRLSDGVSADELFYYMPEDCRWESGLIKALSISDYSLIREDCWDKFRRAIDKNENPDLYHRIWNNWLNPSKHRPAYLYPKHAKDKDEEFPALPKKDKK